MKTHVISHIGNSRINQEDNFLIGKNFLDLDIIKQFSKESPSTYFDYTNDVDNILLAVSDGMGGHSSGEVASYLTLKYLVDGHLSIAQPNIVDLNSIIAKVNSAISSTANNTSEYKGMGATLCGVLLYREKILGFNVGDSRLYRFDNGLLQQLSRDHSEGQRLLDLKLLNEEELKNFPKRKAIYKYIGMKTDLVADVFELAPFEKGTILLLCTDGLTDVLADSEMQEILNTKVSLKEKGEKLLNIALERNVGYGDNITIILTEF